MYIRVPTVVSWMWIFSDDAATNLVATRSVLVSQQGVSCMVQDMQFQTWCSRVAQDMQPRF